MNPVRNLENKRDYNTKLSKKPTKVSNVVKLPTKNQWGHFFKALTKKEKIVFSILLFLFFGSLFSLLTNSYFKNTEIKPAVGGTYIEGVLAGQGGPRYINPIYAETSDVNRDLVEIIFSGLMKYGPEGKIIPDLAEKYEILEDGKIYEFHLKENILWHDSSPMTADDIIFTIETIQNPEIKSPLRVNWLGVEVEKISEKAIRFKLRNPSAVFLENCAVKIIPKRIWQNISAQNFSLTTRNLEPIGSGPYKFKNLLQDKQGNIKSMDLERNSEYFGEKANISQISFQFFNSTEKLIEAANLGKINGFSVMPSKTEPLQGQSAQFQQYSLSLPRYFAVHFNPKNSKTLSENNIRQAINYGTDKETIIKEILGGRGEIVDSPILPGIYGFEKPLEIYEFNPEKAEEILENAGFLKNEKGERVKIVKNKPAFQFKSNLKTGSQGSEVKELQKCLAKDSEVYPEGEITSYFGSKTKAAVIKFQEKYKEDVLEPHNLKKGTGEVGKSTRAKLNEICFQPSEETIPLKFSLSTVNQPLLIEMASLLQSQWAELGIEIDIKTFNSSDLEREVIKPRDYESLLFGEVLGAIPDPFPFWSSLQKKDPGLNLSMYENKKCDKLLEEARQSLDNSVRKKKLEEFQNLLIKDAPVVFLCNPDYLYFVSKEIKGIDIRIITNPSKRFSGIENWHIKTKRAWRP